MVIVDGQHVWHYPALVHFAVGGPGGHYRRLLTLSLFLPRGINTSLRRSTSGLPPLAGFVVSVESNHMVTVALEHGNKSVSTGDLTVLANDEALLAILPGFPRAS